MAGAPRRPPHTRMVRKFSLLLALEGCPCAEGDGFPLCVEKIEVLFHPSCFACIPLCTKDMHESRLTNALHNRQQRLPFGVECEAYLKLSSWLASPSSEEVESAKLALVKPS